MKKTKPSYKLSLVPFVPWVVYLVADTQGIWQSMDLDVSVNVHTTEEAYLDEIINDRCDLFPLPLASTVDFFAMGKPLVYLGMLDQANGHKHLVVKTDSLDQPLKGQSIGLYADESTNRHLVARFLGTRGLTLGDVDLVFLEEQSLAEEFINGNLKAVLAFREIKEKVVTEGRGTVVFTTADYVDPFGLTVARPRFDRIPPDDLRKLYKGRFQALQWIADPKNWNAYKSLVNDVAFKGFPDLGDKTIMTLLNEVRVPDSKTLLEVNHDKFQEIFDDFKKTVVSNNIIGESVAEEFTFEQVVRNKALIEELKAM